MTHIRYNNRDDREISAQRWDHGENTTRTRPALKSMAMGVVRGAQPHTIVDPRLLARVRLSSSSRMQRYVVAVP